MSLCAIGGLYEYPVSRVATQYYLIAIRHVLQPNKPKVRQASVKTLAVVVSYQRLDSLVKYLSKLELGFHRHLFRFGYQQRPALRLRPRVG